AAPDLPPAWRPTRSDTSHGTVTCARARDPPPRRPRDRRGHVGVAPRARRRGRDDAAAHGPPLRRPPARPRGRGPPRGRALTTRPADPTRTRRADPTRTRPADLTRRARTSSPSSTGLVPS